VRRGLGRARRQWERLVLAAASRVLGIGGPSAGPLVEIVTTYDRPV
jgi:hypothetical protein